MTPKTPSDSDTPAAARKAATATGKSSRTPKTAAKAGGAVAVKSTTARSVPDKSPKVSAAKKAAAPKKAGTSPTRKVAAAAAPTPPARSPAAAPARTSLPNLSPDEREARIRLLAYSYYEARDGDEGSAIEDWLRAEAEVAQEIARALQSWAGD
jgi:hypothetical protein